MGDPEPRDPRRCPTCESMDHWDCDPEFDKAQEVGEEETVSYKAEVIADDSGKWCGNGLRFATEKEAEVYVRDLSFRWLAVRETRVVPSDDPVNTKLEEKDGVWVQSSV